VRVISSAGEAAWTGSGVAGGATLWMDEMVRERWPTGNTGAMLKELLIALYRAPHDQSFHGVINRRIDVDVLNRALAPRRGGVVAARVGASSAVRDDVIEVWVDGPRRSRVDQAGSVRVHDGDQLVEFSPGYGAIATNLGQEDRWLTLPELWWRPRALIGAIEIESVTDGTFLNRPCGHVETTRDLTRSPIIQVLTPGDRFAMTVDQATGVVLVVEDQFGDDALSSTRWHVFEPVDHIDDTVFDHAIPADVTVKSQSDIALERARGLGVDLTGVDTSDAQDISRAIGNRRRPGLLDHYVATGEPPSNADEAERDIRAAFAGLSDEDGESLPNVEAGESLAPTVRRAAERVSTNRVKITVSEVKFLSAQRAAVVFAISTEDERQLLGDNVGEAVSDERRWRVARSTFAQLMRLAGVEPPRPG
jgi:hypothetical protein